MIVSIHQPLFLPWLGYLDRMSRADVFVILDHVQFERANYQNRARILVNGEAHWLTVPVVQRSQQERILEKQVDNRLEGRRSWSVRLHETLRRAYRDAPFFELFSGEIKSLFAARWKRLVDLDLATIGLLREAFDIRTPMVMSSQLGVGGAKSDLVLGICRALGASVFLGGMGGSRRYLDAEAFERAGIRVHWQQFRHPVYPQGGAQAFVPGLSALDLLFRRGPPGRERFLAEQTADHEPLLAPA